MICACERLYRAVPFRWQVSSSEDVGLDVAGWREAPNVPRCLRGVSSSSSGNASDDTACSKRLTHTKPHPLAPLGLTARSCCRASRCSARWRYTWPPWPRATPRPRCSSTCRRSWACSSPVRISCGGAPLRSPIPSRPSIHSPIASSAASGACRISLYHPPDIALHHRDGGCRERGEESAL